MIRKSDEEEAILVESILNGDRDAYETFMMDNAEIVYILLRRYSVKRECEISVVRHIIHRLWKQREEYTYDKKFIIWMMEEIIKFLKSNTRYRIGVRWGDCGLVDDKDTMYFIDSSKNLTSDEFDVIKCRDEFKMPDDEIAVMISVDESEIQEIYDKGQYKIVNYYRPSKQKMKKRTKNE